MLRSLKQFGIEQIKTILACLLSGALLALPFNNGRLWIFAWFGFVPLFFALRNKSKGRAFLLSYLTGVIFWSGVIYWLVHVTLPGTILLILYLALYFGIFGLLISFSYLLPILRQAQDTSPKDTEQSRSATYYLLLLPSAWVLLEYIRGHLITGFPWALLGYSQYLNLPVIQIADITGAWGVSFLVMMGNVFIYKVIGNRSWVVGKGQKILLPLLLLLLTLSYGFCKIHLSPITYHLSPLKVSVIQGNIPQEIKWDIKARDMIIDKYFNFTALTAKDRPDLIIWPEASLPVVPQEEPDYFERVKYFVKKIDVPLLLGLVTLKDDFYYNSAILLSKTGIPLAQYDKIHLVPFGEYIPLRQIFGFLETVVPIGEFMAGKDYKVFIAGDSRIKFSVLICFEDVFPGLSRRFVKRGAGFLVNVTNDAWFKKTSAPYQHLQASVFRAVENRVFLVRSANTGVSAFIAPSGRVISKVCDEYGKNIFIDGHDTEEITIAGSLSLYTKYGDIFIIFCVLSILLYSTVLLVQNLKRKA